MKTCTVRERDNECKLCGNLKSLEFDHIYPASLGGKGTLSNLQLLCRSCNAFKGKNLLLQNNQGMMIIGKETLSS